MRAAALGPVFHPGVTELEIAKGTRDLVSAAAPMLGPMIQDMLLLQLRHEVETGAVNASERRAGAPLPGAREVACAFADLVGFTRLGEELPPEGVEQLANRLADIARQVLVPPVRLIKTIGDAVMLISPDTGALLEVILALVDAAEADELLPQLRVGVAYGSAVSRAGDWFGSPVNLASRVTSVARPGSVLVAASAYEQIGDAERFQWSYAGDRRLRGIRDDVDLYRVRRGTAPESA
jgi:adenylate cyclase